MPTSEESHNLVSYPRQFARNIVRNGPVAATLGGLSYLAGHELGPLFQQGARIRPRRVTAVVDGHRFELYGDWRPGAGIGKDFEQNGCHEPITSQRLLGAVDPGSVIYDIGAASGYFAVLASERTASDCIHVFEPASTAGILPANIDTYAPDARLLREPVGDEKLTVDGYAQRHTPPDVVKIDVDGAEEAVLRGMTAVVKRDRPVVLLELHAVAYPEIKRVVRDCFSGLDYRFEVALQHRHTNPRVDHVDLDSLPDAAEFGADYMLIATPE